MSKIHKGDYWSNIYRGMNFSDPMTAYILNLLDGYVQQYNNIHDANFKAFETDRLKDRQRRLLGFGRSWVANISRAPHVEKRATDYAEWVLRGDEWIWVWEDKELRKLHTWLKENFPLFKLLRTGGDFKNVSDLPHYEVKRKIWIEYNK